LVINKYWLTHT